MPSAKRLSSLTQLRWVAALLVFLYHARNFGLFGADAGKLANWAFGAGATGVSLFFILSGFVIAWSARPGDRRGAFWRRRFARIYPLHLATALMALVLAVAAVPGSPMPGRRAAVANLLLVSAWNHDWWQTLNPVSWSLTCEAFFYAAFPLAYAGMRRLGRRGLEATIAASVTAVVILAALAHQDALPISLYDFPATRLPEFLAGVAAGLLVRRGQWRGPATAAAAVLTTVGYFLTAQVPEPYTVAACTMAGFTLLIPALAVARRDDAETGRWTATGERLGEMSYAFYLVHLLVLRCLTAATGSHPPPDLGRALVWTVSALAVSVALAWLLHTYVEVPARRLLLRPKGRN
jgi:peptidoglycan/LPS O-acetylase OafA/YrhL